jgi:hypothetical protein
MTNDQLSIIHMISKEIKNALSACEHSRNDQSFNSNKIDTYISNYTARIKLLREIRNQLENEFTIIHYDPR